MDEKILIKSESSVSKKFLKKCPIICFIITAVISLILAIPFEITHTEYWWGEYYTYTRSHIGWEDVFYFHYGIDLFFFVLFVIASLCFLTAVITGIIYLVNRNCELQITENNVKGKTLLGKEVVLPLYMVSAYSTRKYLSTICVATASGVTKFSLIKNYQEIGNVLAQKINERQKNTEAAVSVAPTAVVQGADAADQLRKFKALLDDGVITQEEFVAKKNQLLGL